MEGAKTFEKDPRILSKLEEFWYQKKLVAAICAAPIALRSSGIGKGLSITSHPCVKNQLEGIFILIVRFLQL